MGAYPFERPYEPHEPILLRFPLATGDYLVLLSTDEVVAGRQARPGDDCLGRLDAGSRTIRVSVHLTLVDYEGPTSADFHVTQFCGQWFRWPLPGQSRAAVARVRSRRVNNERWVELRRLYPAQVVGRVRGQ